MVFEWDRDEVLIALKELSEATYLENFFKPIDICRVMRLNRKGSVPNLPSSGYKGLRAILYEASNENVVEEGPGDRAGNLVYRYSLD